MMQLKSPQPEKATSFQCRLKHITILHPSYPQATLLTFPRLDLDEMALPGADHMECYGVHYNTVLTACQITAGNMLDVYLSKDILGRDRVDHSPDDILLSDSYYLQVPSAKKHDYPIVPNFESWIFPHRNLPFPWDSMDSSRAGRGDLNSCVLSGSGTTETSCLITDQKWFNARGMGRYHEEHDGVPIDTSWNQIPMRLDLDAIMNEGAFALVPKPVVEGHYEMVPHFTRTDGSFASEASQWHNQRLRALASVSPEYLFARFAKTILMMVEPFVMEHPSPVNIFLVNNATAGLVRYPLRFVDRRMDVGERRKRYSVDLKHWSGDSESESDSDNDFYP